MNRRDPQSCGAGFPTCGFTGLSSPVFPSAERATGKSPELADKNVAPPLRLLCFTRSPDDLRSRINARVDEMFSRGLVEETRNLLQHGLDENKFAMQAIGYRQAVEHLRGERTLSETVELVKSRTRQFAKRQLTWFRRHAHSHWIELQDRETAEETAGRILANAKT